MLRHWGRIWPQKQNQVFRHRAYLCFFSDGVMNYAHTKETVKFYFGRADPSSNEVPGTKVQAIAQVAMPMPAFLEMVAFFQAAVEDFISAKDVDPQAWERAKIRVRQVVAA
jgi:hypothetical protein